MGAITSHFCLYGSIPDVKYSGITNYEDVTIFILFQFTCQIKLIEILKTTYEK